jgi:hypothetical protein
VHQHLQEAREDTAKTIALSDCRVLIWDQYGTTWVKKYAKVSPDAFFQMSLQLAYYKIHKKVTATYETASTRQFLHGRTETIRTCSVDTKKLAEAWYNDRYDVCIQRCAGYGVLYHSLTDAFFLPNVEQNQIPAFANSLQESHSLYCCRVQRTGM